MSNGENALLAGAFDECRGSRKALEGIVIDKVSGKLTVFFEEPVWVGVLERILDGKLSVCKITFGVEPKDYEV